MPDIVSIQFLWCSSKEKEHNLLVNVTYHSPKVEKEINDLVGKAFGFLDRVKMDGIGSGRLIIKEASTEIRDLIEKTVDTGYSNIELRPNGIIVGIKSVQETFHWVIPYYKLTIYKNAGHISVYDGKHKMNLSYEQLEKSIMKFLNKVMEGKANSRSYPE